MKSIAILIFGLLLSDLGSVKAAPVVSVGGGSFGDGYPDAYSLHGWQFVANQAIWVTHLGLFDQLSDGFPADHPIGLFRLSDSLLLTSGTIHQGTGDLL